MYGEIVTIGNELISGRTLDLNAGYAAGKLTAAGLRVTRMTSVGDDEEMVSKTLAKALETSCFVIVTGGLGPTDDDMTNEIVSTALNRSLCLDQQVLDNMKKYAETMGIEMTPSIEKMAWIPQGARILNPKGPSCGCCIEEQGVRLYFLPGVPDQMRRLLDDFVIPELLNIYPEIPATGQRILKVYGVNEPEISETLKEIKGKTGDVVLGFYPDFPENHITLSLSAKDDTTVTDELDRIENEIRGLLNPFIFATGHDTMEKVVGRALLYQGLTLSIAESCSGGLIAHHVTNVPGSSAYFKGGVVVYSNELKTDLLNVNPDTLKAHGAVSEQTVREMVQGLKNRFKTDLSIAVTGIAGPEGGTAEKPVGTVFIGMNARDRTYSRRYRFWGNRGRIKQETAFMALDWIRRILNGSPLLPGI